MMRHDSYGARLLELAKKGISDCTIPKQVSLDGEVRRIPLLLPSGDETYDSFWIRDCAMMAESGLLDPALLQTYIALIASCGQNDAAARNLANGLIVPPFAVADHINYDGRPVFFPGTYASGHDQGDGSFGFYPPLCDNYYFVMMTAFYVRQTGDRNILQEVNAGRCLLDRLELAFNGHGTDKATQLCFSDPSKPTVDWGFCDQITKTGLLLMPSILRANAAEALSALCSDKPEKQAFYRAFYEKICASVYEQFFDAEAGLLYSAAGTGKQHDVWGSAYAVYSGILPKQVEAAVCRALTKAYLEKRSCRFGSVRHILLDEDAGQRTAWEKTFCEYNRYQNGGFWPTATGWYFYSLYQYDHQAAFSLLEQFIQYVQADSPAGAPHEWISIDGAHCGGRRYGTSAVLPYAAFQKALRNGGRCNL